MGTYIGNVAVVVGDHDVDCIQRTMEAYYGLTVGTVQRVTPETPYTGEIRDRLNSLVHVAVPITLPNNLYDVNTIKTSLDLEAVGMYDEILKRSDLVLVLLQGEDGGVYYYPYKVALYLPSED